MKKLIMSLVCLLAAGTAFATGENIATSKAFVDTGAQQKQEKIPANDGAAQALTNTGTPGNVGTKNIYNASGTYSTQTDSLITAGQFNAAVQNAVFSEFQCISWNANGDCLLVDLALSPNRFPAPENQTQTQNGVTVTVNDGVYSFSGVATADTEFWFELTEPYTFPVAVGQGGRGVMYLWNNKYMPYTAAYVVWYDESRNKFDTWAFGNKNRIVINDNGSQGGKTVKYIKIPTFAGTDMNGFNFAPMVVDDGVETYTTFISHTNPNNFMPASQ